MKKCPECSSENIIPEVKVLERGDGNASYSLRIAVDEKPDALFFKQRIDTIVKAKVCADCGFTRFYANEPKKLWFAYQNQKNNV